MAGDAAEHRHHVHDDIDWAKMAEALMAWDELEVGRNRAIVDWLGVRPGDVVVDVGSGAGGMAAALVDAVGQEGSVVLADGSTELLAVARQHAGRPGHRLVTLPVDLEHQPLGSVLEHQPADLVHASAVVHHLDDEIAAIAGLAAVVRPGGRVAVAEGGLGNHFLPEDCGIGEPGLEQRLAVARDVWFWSEVRPATAIVRTGSGWNVLLAEAGLADVTTRSFLLDLPPPLNESTRRIVRGVFERELGRVGEQIDSDDRATLTRLIDDDDPRGIIRRPDVFVLGVRTVHTGTMPA